MRTSFPKPNHSMPCHGGVDGGYLGFKLSHLSYHLSYLWSLELLLFFFFLLLQRHLSCVSHFYCIYRTTRGAEHAKRNGHSAQTTSSPPPHPLYGDTCGTRFPIVVNFLSASGITTSQQQKVASLKGDTFVVLRWR